MVWESGNEAKLSLNAHWRAAYDKCLLQVKTWWNLLHNDCVDKTTKRKASQRYYFRMISQE